MRAVGSGGSPRLVPVLLDRLGDPAYRGAARKALEAYGARVHPLFLDRLEDEATAPATRATLPGLLVPDAEQDSVDRLTGLLPDLGPAARYEALKALNKLRRNRADLDFDGFDPEALVREEVDRAYRATLRLDALGCGDGEMGRAPGSDDAPEPGDRLLCRTLTQRRREAVERAFRALALGGGAEELYAGFTALGSPEDLTRQRGFELVDTVVPVRFRRDFDPLINPDAEWKRVVEAGRDRLGRREGEEGRERVLEALEAADDLWLALLARHRRGSDGLPPGRGAAELEDRMQAESLLAESTHLRCEEADVMEVVERADYLGRAKIFNDLRTEDLAGIAALVEERRFDADRVLFEEGEAGGTLFVVTEGRIRAEKAGRTLFEAGPGRSVGSLSLLDGMPTNYRATAREPTRTLVLTRTEFTAILEERKRVAESVIGYLTGVVRGLNEGPEEGGG